jgi:hypothetical protein
MTIQTSEILFRKPQEVSDVSTNGGRMSFNLYVSATAANVFGNVFSAARAAGNLSAPDYRKVCVVVANDSEETLYAAMLRLFMPNRGDDWITFHMGSARDRQADISGSETRYGNGALHSAVSAGGATLIIDLKSADLASGADVIARPGDPIFITDKATWNATSGNIEQHIIDTVTASGTQLTITLDGTTLANNYAAWNSETRTGGHIMTAPAAVDVAPALDNYTHTFASTGAIDTAQIVVDSIGSAEMTVSGVFTDATHFICTSDDTTHTLGSGVVGTAFAPINPANSKPYFTIPATALTGTFTVGDVFSFQVHPPALYPYLRRDIPPACGSLSGNQFVLVQQGESA